MGMEDGLKAAENNSTIVPFLRSTRTFGCKHTNGCLDNDGDALCLYCYVSRGQNVLEMYFRKGKLKTFSYKVYLFLQKCERKYIILKY